MSSASVFFFMIESEIFLFCFHQVEDLLELLQEVKKSHSDVTGVSVGAILSSYQRVRVEDVCRRLSLTSLSYLWQRDQVELLAEMIACGVGLLFHPTPPKHS